MCSSHSSHLVGVLYLKQCRMPATNFPMNPSQTKSSCISRPSGSEVYMGRTNENRIAAVKRVAKAAFKVTAKRLKDIQKLGLPEYQHVAFIQVDRTSKIAAIVSMKNL